MVCRNKEFFKRYNIEMLEKNKKVLGINQKIKELEIKKNTFVLEEKDDGDI